MDIFEDNNYFHPDGDEREDSIHSFSSWTQLLFYCGPYASFFYPFWTSVSISLEWK